MGPGVISPGAGTIGQRSGEQVDLRFYGDVMGVFDNGITPYAVNSLGQVATVNGLYGEQVDLGLYGQHSWRQALLGIDFHGDYYHYDNDSAYDGNGEFLNIGYTYQKSRRLTFNFHGVGGNTSIGIGSPGYYDTSAPTTVVGQQSSILFDNRVYYVQAGADVTYMLTARTSFTVGADGFTTRYQAEGLIGLDGYQARGSIQHRLSRTKTIGLIYQYMYYDFVRSFGESQINMGQLFFATSLGKRWTVSIAGGIFQSQVQGVEQIALSPVVAALLGQSVGFQAFNTTNYYPSVDARLTGKFKTSQFTLSYSQSVTPGDGVYLTSRQDIGGASYSYTATRKWNIGGSLSYYRLDSLGQNIMPYNTYGAGAGFTYRLPKSLHIIGRYDYRRQDIEAGVFRRDASRVTLGLGWSPGNVPLSLW
jgi:hypothetical protein